MAHDTYYGANSRMKKWLIMIMTEKMYFNFIKFYKNKQDNFEILYFWINEKLCHEKLWNYDLY